MPKKKRSHKAAYERMSSKEKGLTSGLQQGGRPFKQAVEKVITTRGKGKARKKR